MAIYELTICFEAADDETASEWKDELEAFCLNMGIDVDTIGMMELVGTH